MTAACRLRRTELGWRPAGTVIDDRYRIDGEIDRGGCSWVLLGTDLATGEAVAVKSFADGMVEQSHGEVLALSVPAVRECPRFPRLLAVSRDHRVLIKELVRGRAVPDLAPFTPMEAFRVAAATLDGYAALDRAGLTDSDVGMRNQMARDADHYVVLVDTCAAEAGASKYTEWGSRFHFFISKLSLLWHEHYPSIAAALEPDDVQVVASGLRAALAEIDDGEGRPFH